MKRLILAAILLFPVVTLVFWFYWGANQSRLTPANASGPTNTPAQTNLNAPLPIQK